MGIKSVLLAQVCAGLLVTSCIAQFTTQGGACGSNNLVCPDGQCCSQYNFCGVTTAHCDTGCQPAYGACTGSSTPTSSPAATLSGTPSSPASSTSSLSPSVGTSKAAIIGGVVGGLGGLAVLIAIGYVLVRRRSLHADDKTTLLAELGGQDAPKVKDIETGIRGGNGGGSRTAVPCNTTSNHTGAAARSSAATSAPVAAYTSPPLGAPGVGSGLSLGPTGGGNPVEVVLAVSVAAVCAELAMAIVAAADRVVANHVRCKRLVGRVARMQPLLAELQVRQAERPASISSPLEAQLQHIRSTLEDVRSLVSRWCDGSGSMVAVLRNLVSSHWYQQDFVDLNTQLSEAYGDLGLMLGMQGGEANNTDKTQMAIEAQGDLSLDMRQLAEDLTTNTELWSKLNPKQQGELRAAYAAQGQDLDELARQARRDLVRRKVKDLFIPRKDVVLQEAIGAGGFGTVYRANWQGVTVAVKELSKAMLTERAQRSLENEGYIMSITRHPNVAQFYGLIVEPGLCALVMRFYPRGSLLHLLHTDSCSLTWFQRCRLALDVARGMDHLHSRPFESIIHGDLKASNLLVTDDGSVVISDFGLSRVPTLTKTMTGTAGVGSLSYMAPELIVNPMHPLTTATDVYSFSMVMYELATGRMPFNEAKMPLVANHVQQGGRPPIPDSVPLKYAQLMRRCWAQQPEERPAFSDIVQNLVPLASSS